MGRLGQGFHNQKEWVGHIRTSDCSHNTNLGLAQKAFSTAHKAVAGTVAESQGYAHMPRAIHARMYELHGCIQRIALHHTAQHYMTLHYTTLHYTYTTPTFLPTFPPHHPLPPPVCHPSAHSPQHTPHPLTVQHSTPHNRKKKGVSNMQTVSQTSRLRLLGSDGVCKLQTVCSTQLLHMPPPPPPRAHTHTGPPRCAWGKSPMCAGGKTS